MQFTEDRVPTTNIEHTIAELVDLFMHADTRRGGDELASLVLHPSPMVTDGGQRTRLATRDQPYRIW